jgi:hypothetical protein
MTDSKQLKILVVNSLVPSEDADEAEQELALRPRGLRVS